MIKIYINKKNGREYKVLNTYIIDATNGREQDECMVLYTDHVGVYVRKESEFYENFMPKDDPLETQTE